MTRSAGVPARSGGAVRTWRGPSPWVLLLPLALPALLTSLPIPGSSQEPVLQRGIGVLKGDADGDGLPDRIGEEVTVSAVLTVPFARGGTGYNAHLQDESGGIALLLRDADAGGADGQPRPWPDPAQLREGDLLRVHGRLEPAGGIVMLVAREIEHVGRVLPPSYPEVSVAEVLGGGHGGDRVRLTARVEVTPGAAEPARLVDRTGSIPLWLGQDLLSNVELMRELTRGGRVSIAGVVQAVEEGAGGIRYRVAADARTPVTFHPPPPWGWILLGVVLLVLLSALVRVIARNVAAERRNREMEAMVERLAEARRTLRASEEALARSEAQYRSLVEHAPFGVFRTDAQGRFLFANRALHRILGHRGGLELTAGTHTVRSLFEEQEKWESMLGLLARRERTPILRVEWRREDGELRTVRIGLRRVSGAEREGDLFEGFVEDVTERIRLEEQLRQAQKMEGIGQLAGGIAHDFNNLLTVILGGCAFVLERDLDPGARAEAEEIREAAERAASLTRQLLAFSKRQPLLPSLVDVNERVGEALKLLRRVIGDPIRIEEELASDLPPVEVDPGQFEQVVMNLVVNARDAMPRGGRIRIRTEIAELGGPGTGVPEAGLPPGRYVAISVQDEGEGIPPDLLDRIFEPFFTTKEVGKGTGLGLSTVYGIVSQSGGHVRVESGEGRGATFHVYLPTADGGDTTLPEESVAHPAGMGSAEVGDEGWGGSVLLRRAVGT